MSKIFHRAILFGLIAICTAVTTFVSAQSKKKSPELNSKLKFTITDNSNFLKVTFDHKTNKVSILNESENILALAESFHSQKFTPDNKEGVSSHKVQGILGIYATYRLVLPNKNINLPIQFISVPSTHEFKMYYINDLKNHPKELVIKIITK